LLNQLKLEAITLETRKLQRIGNTLYVSIPKSWTNGMQLKQGDSVTLIPKSDNSLCIYLDHQKEKSREITINLNDETSMKSLRREIVAAYVDGFDIIRLIPEKVIVKEQQNTIRTITNSLFGLEIIEISGEGITIQCLLTRTIEIEKTIQRIYNVISSMFQETIIALREQKTDQISGISQRKQDIRRLSLVTNRLLRSFLLFPNPENQERLSPIDCVDYLQILHITSEIACNVDKISNSIKELNEKDLPKIVLEPLYQVNLAIHRSFAESVQSLLTKDMRLANKTLDNTPASAINLEEMWNFFNEPDKTKISSQVLPSAYLLIDCLKRINNHTAEIAEIAIDRTEAASANDKNKHTKKCARG